MAMEKIATITPVSGCGGVAKRQKATKLMFAAASISSIPMRMNFAWRFMLPMAFTCLFAAAIWHYQARGLAGWFWSLGIVALVYFGLSRLLATRKNLSTRTYRFAE